MADPRQELEQLRQTLESFDPEHSERYFGVRLMRESLERRLRQVEDGMRGRLDVGLTRASRSGTGAELFLVAGVLSSLQDGLASIAQVLAGRPTGRGLIP